MDRYVNSYMAYSFIENNKYGYRQEWIYDDENNFTENKMCPIVYGKNKNADKIIISVKGKEFEQKLKKDEYFMAIYPDMISFDEEALNKVYSGEENNVIQIKFVDNKGKEVNNMSNLDKIEE